MTANVKLDGIADYLEARFSRATIDPKFREVLAALRSHAQGMYSEQEAMAYAAYCYRQHERSGNVESIAAWKAAQIAGKEKVG